MEEMKVLIGMVKDLPNAALWVIAALFAYKVCVVGSIYGVLRQTLEAGAREMRLVAAQEEFVNPSQVFEPERFGS